MKKRFIAFLALPALLAACVSQPPHEEVEQVNTATPINSLPAGGEARGRAKVHTDLGLAYLEINREAQAINEAKIALGIDGAYPMAYNLLGLVYQQLKDNAQADNAFRQALSFAPGEPEISNNYGWFLCQSKREKQSLVHFRTAYTNPLFGGVAVAMTNGGICAEKAGDFKLADELFARAQQREPENARTLINYAEFLVRQGRNVEARNRLNELHRQGDTTARSTWLALNVARRLGDRLEEARFVSLMRQRFSDSREYELLIQGRYE